MEKEAEDRRLADSHILLGQSGLKFSQRDVGSHAQPSRNPRPVPLQSIAFVTTELLGTDAPPLSPTAEKAAYRTDAHSTQFSRLFIGVAGVDRVNYITAQVL